MSKSYLAQPEEHFQGEGYWLAEGLRVTADGTGIVSHAGVALIRALADSTGLTGGLSKALASRRLLVHDRGRVMADLACAIADGGEVISNFRVIGDQRSCSGWSRRCPRRGAGPGRVSLLGTARCPASASRARRWMARKQDQQAGFSCPSATARTGVNHRGCASRRR